MADPIVVIVSTDRGPLPDHGPPVDAGPPIDKGPPVDPGPPKEKRKLKDMPKELPQLLDTLREKGRVKILDSIISVPQMIATVITPDQEPFVGAITNPEIIKQLLNFNISGIVNDGKCDKAFQVESPTLGVYKITHGLGYTDLCLSVGPLQACSLRIKENASTYFVVEATLEGDPVETGFVFTLSRVIS